MIDSEIKRIPYAGTSDHEVDGSWDSVDFLEGVMRIRLREGKRLYKSWID